MSIANAYSEPVAPRLPSRWVVANAGSGKTYTLIWRVVQLLLHGATPEGIWCVSYTKAAAGEMRERLLKRLKELQTADDAQLQTLLAQWVHADDLPHMCQQARGLFTRVIDSPQGGVRFTTVHGLCQSILQSFPLEAGIPAGFSLIEAQEQSRLMRQSIRQVLSAPTHTADVVRHAIARVCQQGTHEHIVDRLSDFFKNSEVLQRVARLELGEIRSHYVNAAGFEEGMHETTLRDAFLADLSVDCGEAMAALCASKNAKDAAFGMLLRDFAHGDFAQRLALYARYIQAFFNSKNELRNLHSSWFSNKTLPYDSQACALLMREQQRVVAHVLRMAEIALAEDSAALAVLAKAAWQIYQQHKARAAVLDYDDLLLATHRLFTAPEMMPWVMSKLDYRLEHLMIDEAQDTSPLQWQLVHALVDIIEQSEQGGLAKTLFVVGDEKQSIYSFQGAAPWLLEGMKQAFDLRLRGSSASFEEGALAHSYRSGNAVLEVVNALCTHPDVKRAFSADAAPMHLPTREDAYSRVEVWPLIEPLKPDALPPYTIPTSYALHESGTHRLATQVANTIRAWLDAATPIQGRAICAGDILILVRTRSKLVPAMIQALEAAHVPVAGVDRLALADHIAVKDMMALIAWMHQPSDDVSLAQVLRSPLFGVSEEGLLALAYGRGEQSLFQRLQQLHAAFAQQLEAWRNLRHGSAYALIQHVLEGCERNKCYATRMGEEVYEVLDELLHFAASLHGTPDAALLNFMQRMQQDSPVIVRENADADKVRIMTVHGAKGLEAPVVFLVDTTRAPTLGKEYLYVSEEGLPYLSLSDASKLSPHLQQLKDNKRAQLQEEYYRLLYVAATRAADILVVAGMGTGKSSSIANWYEVLEMQVKALPTAQQRSDGAWVVESGALPAPTTVALLPVAQQTVAPWMVTPPPEQPKMLRFKPSGLGAEHTNTSASGNANARVFGTQLHQCLQWVTPQTPREDVVRYAALNGADGEALWAHLQPLRQSAEITELWQKPALCEQEIAGEITVNGALYQVFGSMDRLVVLPHEIWVIDYKTSANPPAADATPLSYVLQLKTYHTLLKPLYPSHRIRLGLLWTSAARLDWIESLVEKTPWPVDTALLDG